MRSGLQLEVVSPWHGRPALGWLVLLMTTALVCRCRTICLSRFVFYISHPSRATRTNPTRRAHIHSHLRAGNSREELIRIEELPRFVGFSEISLMFYLQYLHVEYLNTRNIIWREWLTINFYRPNWKILKETLMRDRWMSWKFGRF